MKNNMTLRERLAVLETEMVMIKRVLFALCGGTVLNIGVTVL